MTPIRSTRAEAWALRGLALLGLLATGACDGTDPERLLDTGWFDDTGGTDWSSCPQRIASTEPADGDDGWSWRRAPVLYTEVAGEHYEARLTDALGRIIPVTLQPANDAGLVLEARFEGGLAPDTEHVLEVRDCAGPREIRFTTSSYGTPLQGGPTSLLGRSWVLDLAGAEWVQPGGFGPILAANFTTPVLVGVQYVDDRHLDLIGAQGYTFLGNIRQDNDEPTWDFPVVGFEEAPFFQASAASVDLVISGFRLPVTDFVLSGTFAADGSDFRGGVLEGIGDTRFAGGALGQPDNPDAVCDLGESLGVPCEPCPTDGEVYCLQVELRQLVGTEVEELTLDPVSEETD